jgi:hypothetical protein
MQMNNQYPNSIYNPQIQPYFQYGNYGGNQYQQQRFEPQQQFQQQMQPVQQSQSTFINGKIVPSVDVINANDVPMDGSVAIFPKQDMSEIYAKQWNADGTIRTVVFKPALNEQANNLSNDKEKTVLEALEDVINFIFGKIRHFYHGNTSKNIFEKLTKKHPLYYMHKHKKICLPKPTFLTVLRLFSYTIFTLF